MGSKDKLVLGLWNALCSQCKVEKPIVDFYLHSNGKPRKQCKSCHLTRNARWAENNQQRKFETNQQWQKQNRDRCNAFVRKWRQSNKSYDAMRQRERHAKQIQAMPNWVNRDELKQIYLNCPTGHQVDHIVPLRGEYVSGLHVPWNLQYLPGTENQRKGNRYGQS